MLLKPTDLGEVLFVKAAELRVLVVLGPKTAFGLQPQRRFNFAKLFTLKPGCAMKQLAKLEKVERGHGLEHIDLVIKQFPNLDHSFEPVHHDVHVRSVVIRGRFAQHFFAGRDLVQDLFEPKLVGLVDDDKEHFIMRDQLSLAQAERLLQLEQVLDPR